MNRKYETIIHPLEPLYNEQSKILILGSFPSVKTREYGFFYGHPQNRFWKLMERIFEVDLNTTIEYRKKFLLEHKIALYDSIYQCDIIGSSDSSIKNVVASNLSKIVQNSNIEQVFCNGKASFKCYEKYQQQNLKIKATKLPSTSPANARYSLDDLFEQWKVIAKYL